MNGKKYVTCLKEKINFIVFGGLIYIYFVGKERKKIQMAFYYFKF